MGRELTPEQILDHLGIQYWQRSGRLAFCCPIHDDRDPSAGFYQDTNLAHCFSCGYTVDPILFYAKVNDLSKAEAIRDLEKAFGPLQERVRKHNRHLLNMNRNRGETELRAARGLPRREHALLAETLDKILLAYERDQVDDEALDKLLKIWYNKVRKARNVEPLTAGTTEAGPEAGLEEGPGDLPGPGRQTTEHPVGWISTDDTIDLS